MPKFRFCWTPLQNTANLFAPSWNFLKLPHTIWCCCAWFHSASNFSLFNKSLPIKIFNQIGFFLCTVAPEFELSSFRPEADDRGTANLKAF